ncbi:TPA: hypothetical protein ACQVKY_005339 [Serratia marcescens]|uniref:Uncharacterized protein n=1 Tax=Serratia nevei TaxID=2703794 RepID=A0ABT7G6L3_9GAMM|nr:hypothetical protein [Serratia nevei]HAU4290896.1 hypothetical protein [Serratia marcescens]MDK5169068.1 hypothetical protein [Serratia nevei]MDK5298562.1 hypothetical protein [Serratia nevei]MEC5887186.1 hypothetical protein [Serratia nevei]HAU4297450.1 hypothetical protein [Serratia marcescens]
MTQQQRTEQVEPIFDNKPANDTRVFAPNLADIVKKVLSDIEPENKETKDDEIAVDATAKAELAKTLETLAKDMVDEALSTKVLTMVDPRNNTEYFQKQYIRWARDNSDTHTHLASYSSKVSFWLGSTLIANPASLGLPDYIYYLPKDRMVCFRGHFHPKRIGTIQVSRNILFTNKYIELLRDKVLKRIGLMFLIVAMAVGGATYTVGKGIQGYQYITAKFKSADDKQKDKENAEAQLKQDAETLVGKYKAHEITEAQFNEQAKALKDRQQQIKDLYNN